MCGHSDDDEETNDDNKDAALSSLKKVATGRVAKKAPGGKKTAVKAKLTPSDDEDEQARDLEVCNQMFL